MPRGHWPAGKPRKPPPPIPVRGKLAQLIAAHGLRGTGRVLGVDPRTVRRWADGAGHPSAAEAARIAAAPLTPSQRRPPGIPGRR